MISSGKVKVAFVYFVHCKSNVNRFLRWNCQNICCRSNQHQKANLQRPCALILKEIVCVVSWGRVCFFFPFLCWKQLSPLSKGFKHLSMEEDGSHVWINVFLEWATWPRPNGVWSQRNRGSLNTNSIITTSVISALSIFTSLFLNG